MTATHYLYLINAGVFSIMGTCLLLIWRRHRSQTFARDMGLATLCAVLLPLGYLLHLVLPPQLTLLPTLLALQGAIPSMLFLTSGVLRLAGRRLSPLAIITLAALATLTLVLPPAGHKLFYWPILYLLVLCGTGALAMRWLWRQNGLERWIGPLLILLGLNQLFLIIYAEQGLAANILWATLIRTAIGVIFALAALEGAIRDSARLAVRFQQMTEHTVQGVLVTDSERILYANPAVRNLYGVPLGQGAYATLRELPAGLFCEQTLQRYHQMLQNGQQDVAHWEDRCEVAGGRKLELRFEAWRVEWDGQQATQILITDDSERNASARALLHQASHDELTGLPNRSVLMRHLREYCYLDDGSMQCTLVVLNIDRFKLFNQSQGDLTGDQLLKAFAAALAQALGETGELMRLGGDEFAIIDPSGGDVRGIAERLRAACMQALKVPGGEYFIDASMGMAVFPTHADSAEALLRAANAAMYQAKRTPGTSLAMAEQRFVQMSRDTLATEQALRKGIRNHEFYLEYQPKIDAASGKLLGFEALARWYRPEVGQVSPVEFIAVAERTGLIGELGSSLLELACCQIARWRSELGACVPVAVNVSPVQLLNPGFPQRVKELLEHTGIPAESLTLEITESAAVDNLEDTRQQLTVLEELGIKVAMDDFGTGFSSLSMLRQLPLSTVKIDRGLIEPLPAPDAVAVVRAICQLAAALDLEVVAEGIETLEQAITARDAGCHVFQGYFYAKPQAVADAGAWMARLYAEQAGASGTAGSVASLAG
ncbi:putative bifunctional diguanylate cyclase/phosphodiesterase [Pseudoduganella danionis]|uniref:putative bifunctional diguanylate cyclase/phosphodiesterase n=1 Tax=Pseudoduganella danionis TaxID=1890295 RepID=UPI0035B32CFC